MKFLALADDAHAFTDEDVDVVKAWVQRRNKALGVNMYRVVKVAEVSDPPMDEHEKGYVDGMNMARRLLRLQLGLAVPEDRL